jgi:hypothetical protein
MSRIYLGGIGEAIPLEALPDPTVGDLPPIRVLFDASENFDKTDFVSLGYTHWEAYAIGAMGGRGGRVSNYGGLTWTVVQTQPTMSPADWDLYLELMVIYASMLTPPYGPYGGTEAGTRAYYESQSPAHNPFIIYTHSLPVLTPLADIYGGAGGGGGLHLVAGLLSALSTLTPVVVGVPGADGAAGQNIVNGAWTPIPYQLTYFDEGYGGSLWRVTDTRLKELNNWATNYMYRYPGSHPSFNPPGAGADGGASSFGGALCRASGGKAGKAAQKWVGAVLTYDAAGGDGGEGNTATAGGGGAGSTSSANGADGVWDGTTGEGGGGGRGGHPSPASIAASSGGQGAYSFADTTVYGNRGVRDLYTPGGGGGAKVGSYKYGGAAVGWNPGGAVVLRLTAPV